MPLKLLNPVKALSYSVPANLIAVAVEGSNVMTVYSGPRPGPLPGGAGKVPASPPPIPTVPTRIVELPETHKGPVRCLRYNHKGLGIVSLGADAENKYWAWDDTCRIDTLPTYKVGEPVPMANEA